MEEDMAAADTAGDTAVGMAVVMAAGMAGMAAVESTAAVVATAVGAADLIDERRRPFAWFASILFARLENYANYAKGV